jgi:hypothetical protein
LDAGADATRLHESFHERNLIDACAEVEVRECGEGLFAQVSSTVDVIAALLVAVCKVLLIGIDMAGEASGYGPHGTGAQVLQQDRVGHEASDATIAIDERMNPQDAVMGRGGG